MRGFALPPPCQRYTPFGFLASVLRGVALALGATGAAKTNMGEVPRTGVRAGLAEKRNGSGLSSSSSVFVVSALQGDCCGWTYFACFSR